MDVPAAADALREAVRGQPRTAIVLGSGLSHLADEVTDPRSVSFEELPGFPPSGVAGHAGRFVAGRFGGVEVILQAGRYHAYEGHPMEVVVAPVRLLRAIGVETLIVTNAAGGIDPRLEPGDIVLIDDQINLMGRSPLVGPVAPGEERFPDMSAPYDPELQEVARSVASDLGIPLPGGTYAAMLGPAYETAAEVRMLGLMGAQMVGMSTVPEVLTARASGMRCLGFSMVTNKATGLSQEPIGHQEVMEMGKRAGLRLGRLIEGVVGRIGVASQSTDAK
jgi:purine-nucleoside phosphorylase